MFSFIPSTVLKYGRSEFEGATVRLLCSSPSISLDLMTDCQSEAIYIRKTGSKKRMSMWCFWHKHIYNLWHSTDTEHALKLYQNFTDTWSVFNNTGSAAMSVDYCSVFTYLLWGRWTDARLRVLVGLWLRSSRKCDLTVGWGIPLENFRRVCEICSWLHTMEWRHTL